MAYQSRLALIVDARSGERELRRFESRLNEVDRAGTRTSGAVERVNDGIASTRGVAMAATGALAGLTGAMSAGQIIRYADAWTNTTNQIQQVTSTSEELLDVQQKLVQVALDTRSNFESTANLYSRLARSTTELGLSQQDLLNLTTTINQSFAVSGATAEEAANAITQLSQGLAAGALRGDEFNSVAEQAPGILRAVAESLNMNIGELREFAATGGITAEIVVEALQLASEEIDQTFGGSIASFGQKMEVANTQIIEWVGTSEQVGSAVNVLGDSIVGLTENIDLLVDAGIGIAAIYGARLTASLASSAAGIVNNITVTRAHTIALAENQAMEAGRAATMARTTAAEQAAAAQRASIAAQRAAQDRAAIAQDAQRLASTQAALAAERALETQRLQAQISATGRQQSIARLAELRASETAVTNQLTAANQRLTQAEAAEASAKRAATMASVEKTRADAAATAAMGTYTTAATAATRANGLLAASGRVAAGAMALVGGPVGAAVVAAGAIYY
ncbi:tape measure protein, partial [Halomonas sp. 707B3]|uniref:tape measure protein n=1 Tax=Halomonas sp. 707B3 TaxID=1681043 RepID=UPI0020A037A0